MRLGLYIGKAFTARKASVFDTVVLDKNSQVPHAALDVLPDFLAAAFVSGVYLDGNRIITLKDKLLSTLYVLEGYVESDPTPPMQRPALFRIKRVVAEIPVADIVEAIMKRVKEIQSSRGELSKQPGELKKMMTVSFKDNMLAFEIRYFDISSIDELDIFLRDSNAVLGSSRINVVVNALVFTMIDNWGVTTFPHIYSYIANALPSGEAKINAAGIEQNFRIPWMIINDSIPANALADSNYIDVISTLSQKIGRRIR